jgi:hypothetical protein
MSITASHDDCALEGEFARLALLPLQARHTKQFFQQFHGLHRALDCRAAAELKSNSEKAAQNLRGERVN